MHYETSIQLILNNCTILCCINWSPGKKEQYFPVQLTSEVEEIIIKEMRLDSCINDTQVLITTLTQLPEVATSGEWTGHIKDVDWAKKHGQQITIEGSFRCFYADYNIDTDVTYHKISIQCINGIADFVS